MNCQHCHTTINPQETGYTLCTHCELTFASLLMQAARDVTPLTDSLDATLHPDSLDATLHPGGHSPIRIQPATPPTPIRLEVLDLIDLLDSVTTELWVRLNGVDALTPQITPATPLATRLLDCAAHPRLASLPDSGMYMNQIQRLSQQIDHTLDPPEQRREIGPCELCGSMLTAGPNDQWTTCQVCNREQRTLTAKLHRLQTLCFDQTRTGTPSQISKAFTDSGITLKRNTINQWAKRKRITPTGRVDGKPVYLYSDVYRLTIAPAA